MPSYSGVWNLVSQLQARGSVLWPSVSKFFITILPNSTPSRGSSFNNTGNFFASQPGIYNAGGASEATVTVGIITNYGQNGTIVAQKRLGITGSSFTLYSSTVDSSGNLYIGAASNLRTIIAKFDPSLTLLSQKEYYDATGNGSYAPQNISVDTLGNVYFSGNYSFGCDSGETFTKVNSSGVIQFSKYRLGGTSTQNITSDSSGNMYVSLTTSSGGNYEAQIQKYNSANTLVATYGARESSASQLAFNRLSISSDNSIYASGYSSSPKVWKFNSSGTSLWSSTISATSLQSISYSCVDGDGNMYVLCSKAPAGVYTNYIVKFNSSGTVQWQRKLTASVNVFGLNSISWDSDTGLILSGQINNPNVAFSMVVPTDGSKTAAYTISTYTVTYAVSTDLTIANAGVATAPILTITLFNNALTTGTPSIAVSNLGYTSTTTVI